VETNSTLLYYKDLEEKLAEKNIEQKVYELIEKTIIELGYELYDVEYIKEGKEYHLCIYIDKKDSIDINDCEKVNNQIEPILDEADLIKEQYFLEVSSSGLEKKLRKLEHYKKELFLVLFYIFPLYLCKIKLHEIWNCKFLPKHRYYENQ